MQETLEIGYFERGLSKNFEKNNFSTQSLFMGNFMKTRGPGTTYQSLFVIQNMFRKIHFLVIYYLGNFDDLMQSVFMSYSKNYIC